MPASESGGGIGRRSPRSRGPPEITAAERFLLSGASLPSAAGVSWRTGGESVPQSNNPVSVPSYGVPNPANFSWPHITVGSLRKTFR
jgi:hypothetical protein